MADSFSLQVKRLLLTHYHEILIARYKGDLHFFCTYLRIFNKIVNKIVNRYRELCRMLT